MKLTINYRSASAIFCTIIFILLLFAAHGAQAQGTNTVTHTGDNGAGSLRVAIFTANANSAASTIVFNIPGGGVHTITPLTPLPVIEYNTTIDGTTQPGYVGVPLIEINAVNSTHGLVFQQFDNGSTSFVVRGLIINRASDDGIHIENQGAFQDLTVTVTGCYIGTNSSGTLNLGNGGDGLFIAIRGDAVIGGTAFGQRNVISGNGGNGIYFSAPDFGSPHIEIYNNYIGTNAAGTADLGNTQNGIEVVEATTNIIGGTSPGGSDRGNLISGNNGNGILLTSSNGTTVQRNLIGTNAAGTGDLGNSQNGISVDEGDDHLIGSSTSALNRNTVSGNGANGILLTSGVDGVQIFGNCIGTNSACTGNLQNDFSGIVINDSINTQIGLAGNNTARNTISRNNLHGIFLNGVGAGATGNVIQNNFIGTNSSGTALGNRGDGILISGGDLNTIGGSAAGAGNTIGLNLGNGVNILSSTATGNVIRQNSIYINDGLGINLGISGVTPNDSGDADTGANNQQNFPVLQKASPSRIVGTLNSLANQTFTLDFYRVDSCDASGNGEGRYYLASTNVATIGNNASFNFAFAGLTVGQRVTATATGAGGTSEFSQCLAVTPESGDFRFSFAGYFVNESGGSVLLTVNREGGSFGTITVDYATGDGTAIAGQDYTTTGGTLTFLDGETSKTFSVPITDDTMDEPIENFSVTLSNPTGGARLVIPSGAFVTINDNDNPPTISISDVSQAEGDSGMTNFIFTVNLSQPSGFDISVNYATANGTATAGIDYTSASGTVNFSSALGETSKTVAISVNGDLTVELNETFFVDLSNPTNATISDAQGIGTILDDDNPGSLQFSQSPYSGAEGSNVLVTVTRTNGDAGTVSVDYATSGGDAVPNVDYTPASGTLIFNDGEISKNFSVAILSDSENELLETFNIVLSNPIGGATLGTPSTAVVNIPTTPAALGFEGDVAPRPDGDGAILSNDIVQIRRFLNGTHIPDPSVNEFQRADSSPFAEKGDGLLNSADVVQTRRYQNGTSPQQTAGGPLQPSGGMPSLADEIEKSETESKSVKDNLRELRVESVNGSSEQSVTVNILVDAVGDEAEYGFILSYDQTKLSKPVITAGTAGALVRACNTKVAGQINCSVGGFVNNHPASSDAGIGEIAAGKNQILITVTFTVAANTQSEDTLLTLSNVNASSDAPQLFKPRATGETVTIFAPTTVVATVSDRARWKP